VSEDGSGQESGGVLVEVALPLPVPRLFTYRVPSELADGAVPGARVLVPFGRGERTGWISGVSAAPPERGRVRELVAVLDARPSVPPSLLELCRWVSAYYLAPLGQVIRTALPAVLSDRSAHTIERTGRAADAAALEASPLVRRLLDWLDSHPGPQRVERIRRVLGAHAWWPAIRRMVEAGILTLDTVPPRTAPPVLTRRVLVLTDPLESLSARDQRFGRALRQRDCYELVESLGGRSEVASLVERGYSHALLRGLVSRGVAEVVEEEVARDPYARIPHPEQPLPSPTPAQGAVLRTLVAAADAPRPGTFLLRGVTGSGKTLVYLELLRHVVERRGRTAIVLVPEIALTPQTVGRFKAVFGDRVAVLHSALSDGERYDEWRALRSGEKRIVVGARSAVFAPLPDLGAIVVDEEHEGSYKQTDAPRYHAREVAVVRAGLEGAICVLGSATPALETWVNAREGKYGLLELPERIGARPLPPIRVVDLRAERRRARERPDAGPGFEGGGVVLSDDLVEALRQRLARGEQSILLLNRRGYSTFVQCRDCGWVWHCPSCNVSLTYHRRKHRLVCHHCFHAEPEPERCTACGSGDLGFRGIGTEQVERSVAESFPRARLARMDVDTTSGKWAHHEILGRVERGEVDILMGTQMIAKGLDFPNVTLVGVINADVGMNLPDFRASERTFQLLTQVAGRAGRGEKGGDVIVQTALPEHHVIRCAAEHDFQAFSELELEARRSPLYPPYVRLMNVVVSATDEQAAEQGSAAAAAWVAGLLEARTLAAEVELVGPAPCPIDRIRGRWRWHFLLRAPRAAVLGQVAEYFHQRYSPSAGAHDLRIALDRDPVSLL
jgi:primosomal protein N' (replication factor Y) (superfamily II helicase)